MYTSNTAYADPTYEELLAIYRSNSGRKFYDPIIRDISTVLFQLGIKASLKGYKYLRSAIKITIEDPSAVERITKMIYPTVAREYGSTSTRVERSMRSAIEKVDPENIWSKKVLVHSWDHFTNAQFIATVAEYIRMNPIEGFVSDDEYSLA